MAKRFFVGPDRHDRWRWYAEINGETAQRGRHHACEFAAIRAASNIGAPAIGRYRYAHEHAGCLERTHEGTRLEILAAVAAELGIEFGEPWEP